MNVPNRKLWVMLSQPFNIYNLHECPIFRVGALFIWQLRFRTKGF